MLFNLINPYIQFNHTTIPISAKILPYLTHRGIQYIHNNHRYILHYMELVYYSHQQQTFRRLGHI